MSKRQSCKSDWKRFSWTGSKVKERLLNGYIMTIMFPKWREEMILFLFMSFPEEPGRCTEMCISAEWIGRGSGKLLHCTNCWEIFYCLDHWLRQSRNYGVVLKIATPGLVPAASVSLQFSSEPLGILWTLPSKLLLQGFEITSLGFHSNQTWYSALEAVLCVLPCMLIFRFFFRFRPLSYIEFGSLPFKAITEQVEPENFRQI